MAREKRIGDPEHCLISWIAFERRSLHGGAPQDPMPGRRFRGRDRIVSRIRAFQVALFGVDAALLPAGSNPSARSRERFGWMMGGAEEFLRDIVGLSPTFAEIDEYVTACGFGAREAGRLRRLMRSGARLSLDAQGFLVAIQRAAGRPSEGRTD